MLGRCVHNGPMTYVLYLLKVLPEASHFWPMNPFLQEQSPLLSHSNAVEPSGLHLHSKIGHDWVLKCNKPIV